MSYPEESVSISEIIKGQLYIGNLSAAQTPPPTLNITHVLSICPDFPSTGANPNHLTIPINDTEYDDLLIHLPRACEFIRKGIEDDHGRVLVHCVMGISRSATVIVAYLMRTTLRTPLLCLRTLQKKRPQAHPNYGFLKQLEAFEECGYEPSPRHPAYLAWRRRHKRDVGRFLGCVGDVAQVKLKSGGEVFFTSEFPAETYASSTLLITLGITHLLTLSPSSLSTTLSSLSTNVSHKHLNISNTDRASLLLSLPEAAGWVAGAVKEGGVVLVHCLAESRGVAAVCAAVMQMGGLSVEDAFGVVDQALPLFNPTSTFHRTLELFQLTSHNPTPTHPLVRAWLAEEGWDAWSRASYDSKSGFGGASRRGSNESTSTESEGSSGSSRGKGSLWGSEESTPWGSENGSRATTPDLDEKPLPSPPLVSELKRGYSAPVTTKYKFEPRKSKGEVEEIISPGLSSLRTGYFAPKHHSQLDESEGLGRQYAYLEDSGIDMSAFGETLAKLGTGAKMQRLETSTGDVSALKTALLNSAVRGRDGREGRRQER
ncbi:hypothetical protein BDQ17DRAFT_1361597 [Cyathus striatus]|nr:hypothetical protein BDQ17DRAFT_1361597 [Cyathus striatus]